MCQSDWSGWFMYAGEKYDIKFNNFDVNPKPSGKIKGDGTDTFG